MRTEERITLFDYAVSSSHVKGVMASFNRKTITPDMLVDMQTKGRQAIRDVFHWEGNTERGLELARYVVLARHRQEPHRLALALSFQFTENGDTPCGTWEIAVT